MIKKWHVVLILALVTISAKLHAEAWSCRNSVEIQCNDISCTAAKNSEFTPMDVNFDTSGNFSVCAYSGCWEGKGRVVTSGTLVVIRQEQANWSVPNKKIEMHEDISVVFTTTDRIALIKAGRFVLPMHCSK